MCGLTLFPSGFERHIYVSRVEDGQFKSQVQAEHLCCAAPSPERKPGVAGVRREAF